MISTPECSWSVRPQNHRVPHVRGYSAKSLVFTGSGEHGYNSVLGSADPRNSAVARG